MDDQLVRQRDRIVDAQRRRKQRIQDLCEHINPYLTTAARGFLLTEAGRAFLRTYLDPRGAVRLGKKRLALFLQKRYRLQLDENVLDAIYAACKDASELYKPVRKAGLVPFNEEILQEEMQWELDQLQREETRILLLERQIKQCNQTLDPQESLLSLPGVQHTIAAGLRTCIGILLVSGPGTLKMGLFGN